MPAMPAMPMPKMPAIDAIDPAAQPEAPEAALWFVMEQLQDRIANVEKLVRKVESLEAQSRRLRERLEYVRMCNSVTATTPPQH